MTAEEHLYVKIARETIEEYASSGRVKGLHDSLTPDLEEKAGVFVSIKKNGQLRGCIGTIQPTEANLAREIERNAISAANYDPRFEPIQREELNQLEISVDVLGKSEEIQNRSQLDPNKYGVIVEKGFQRGVLLPALEGVNTVEEQLDIACRKAGIAPDSDHKIYRFEVKRYK